MLIGGHNLPPNLPWTVVMVRTTFADRDIGNYPPPLDGTGFWIDTADGHRVLATNRHLVDPSLAFFDDASLSKCKLVKTEIRLRRNDPKFIAYEPGDVFEALHPYWMSDVDADAAILIDPVFDPADKGERHTMSIPEAYLADKHWTNENVQMMDECFFIGYPAFPFPLYNQWSMFPIARQAIIASDPYYRHDRIRTQGTMLVSGLSVGGSSGSPVLVPHLGIPAGSLTSVTSNIEPVFVSGAHRESRVIGIMSGSFYAEKDPRSAGFLHAGLSYFTHSAYLLALIKRARAADWRQPVPPT